MDAHSQRKKKNQFVSKLEVLLDCLFDLVLFGVGFQFPCVTSSGHEVKLEKHGHGVIMSYSLDVIGLGGNGYRFSNRVRGEMCGA
jgi:hypothetical protein